MLQNVFRRAVLTTALTIGLSSAAFAAFATEPPSTGLGQAWPNTTDVSVSPRYHAYVFVLGGIQYIQINDLNGNVLGSVGTAGGQFIVLPIGKFAQYVSTPQHAAAASNNARPASSPATVYNDGATTVTATPMSDGTTQLTASPVTAQDTCTDPAICSSNGP
ncbi:MAG TPA: hypothetical protein VME63_16860 [Dyella sp.]|uniref:hypothetical protein n=1 Tax=Dyella sp. TaxID=1869338 RepID=UPI002BB9E0B2|nr:hypothetical protein [Dyella sp.]HTV87074.1 hypothetical protein [Dyella sp.]